MVPAPFIVVLDANVLFPFTLRDTLLRAAVADESLEPVQATHELRDAIQAVDGETDVRPLATVAAARSRGLDIDIHAQRVDKRRDLWVESLVQYRDATARGAVHKILPDEASRPAGRPRRQRDLHRQRVGRRSSG